MKIRTIGNLLITFLLISSVTAYTQETEDQVERNLKFSGSINLNTNGISPVPAFSLDKPSVIGTFSLEGKRLAFTPEAAFSTRGKPWFINPRITYKMVDGDKFKLALSTLYSFTYSNSEEMIDNVLQTSTTVEHYALLQSTSTYTISEKVSIGLTTFHGLGLENASIQRGNFFILGTNITNLKITENLYHSLFPQLVYIDLDGDSQGFFASAVYGIGHKKWPFFLSTQLTQSVVTNISPKPGFKWNIGLSYIF